MHTLFDLFFILLSVVVGAGDPWTLAYVMKRIPKGLNMCYVAVRYMTSMFSASIYVILGTIYD